MNEYTVTIQFGVAGIDESDVENQISHILQYIGEDYIDVSITKEGEWVG